MLINFLYEKVKKIQEPVQFINQSMNLEYLS